MNLKGCGGKWSWLDLRYYPGICPEGLKKTSDTSVKITAAWNMIVSC
jgi:hypothetical protein